MPYRKNTHINHKVVKNSPMGNKLTRLNAIKRIVSDELIGSQEELLERLTSLGISATQSTLSRDFKEINISKMPHPNKGYIYVLSDKLSEAVTTGPINLCDAIIGIKFSNNIAVISTKSGYASAISVIIDGCKTRDILGTIAGDNCIMMILQEEAKREDIIAHIHDLFPSAGLLL